MRDLGEPQIQHVNGSRAEVIVSETELDGLQQNRVPEMQSVGKRDLFIVVDVSLLYEGRFVNYSHRYVEYHIEDCFEQLLLILLLLHYQLFTEAKHCILRSQHFWRNGTPHFKVLEFLSYHQSYFYEGVELADARHLLHFGYYIFSDKREPSQEPLRFELCDELLREVNQTHQILLIFVVNGHVADLGLLLLIFMAHCVVA